MLVNVVRVVCRAEDLRLVDEVDTERLQHLCLDKVTDASFSHHRNRHGVLDPRDQVRIAHAGHSALGANVRGNTLECHHRNGTSVFGDTCLLRGHHVHNDPAGEVIGKAAANQRGRS